MRAGRPRSQAWISPKDTHQRGSPRNRVEPLGARAAGPHPRRQARFQRMRAGRPRSQAWIGPRDTHQRGSPRNRVAAPSARAIGAARRQSLGVPGSAGRWPASAPTGAVPENAGGPPAVPGLDRSEGHASTGKSTKSCCRTVCKLTRPGGRRPHPGYSVRALHPDRPPAASHAAPDASPHRPQSPGRPRGLSRPAPMRYCSHVHDGWSPMAGSPRCLPHPVRVATTDPADLVPRPGGAGMRSPLAGT